MFWSRKSYSDDEVLEVAILLREIDQKAEEKAPRIAEGMLKWAKKDPSNKQKVHKAMGILHGIVAGKYSGEPSDFDKFFKAVIIRAFNYGFSMKFGKIMFRDHMTLRNKMDEDYFAGIKEGKQQAATGEDYYLKHRLTW
jgi:hypothetical protein